MAFACHCTLFLLLLVAGLCDATDYNILDFELARKHELWVVKYRRVYKDKAEKARRFEIFKENIKYITDFNNVGGHKYTLGEGPFTDLTTEEFLATYTGGLKVWEAEFDELRRSFKYETMESLNYTTLPSSVDWRTEGAVTPVKNQGTCESCWAFTAAATVESFIKIKEGVLYDLSPQQLVDCDYSSNGCNRGYTHLALEYIKRRGITTWSNYPYKGVTGNCDVYKESQAVATIKGVAKVPRSDERSLMAAVAQQPVAVAVEASPNFQHYTSGIFHGYCGSRINHAVTLIGYGENAAGKYWIVKNSWSDQWGEAGFIRMEKDVASPHGLCGIATYAYYPTL